MFLYNMRFALDVEIVEIVEREPKKANGKKKTTALSKLDELTATALEESANIGDGHCGAFLCPLCDSIAAKSTGEDGETSYWCPIKCLLPWKDNASKPAFYAEIAASVDGIYRQQDGGKPPVCSHGGTMRLIHLDKSKVKNEFLKNVFFFICARAVKDGQCGDVVYAELPPGKMANYLELLFANRKTN